MNFNTNSVRRILRWATGGAASLLTAASAFGQTSLTQSVPILINDATSRSTGPNTFVSDTAAATPFPSSLVTSNLLGTIERVTVTLNGVTHAYPDDVNVALKNAVSGKVIQLMSDAGDRFALNGVNLSFADAATASLPDSSVISDGTYKPTDVADTAGDISGVDLYPGGPLAPFSSTLAVFTGDIPNGSWDLYVADDQSFNSGSIRSWTLNVFTTPLLTVTNTVISATEDTVVNVPLNLQDSDTALSAMTFKVTSSDTTKVPNDLLVTGDGENRVLVIQPKANANGTVTVTVIAKDGVGESIPVVLTVNITAVNDAPLITLSTNSVNTVVGKSASLIAVVNDVDSTLSNLTITATSSNTNVVESAGLVVTDGTNTTSRTLTINPRGAASGTATLTISIVDTGSAGVLGTTTVSLDVTVAPVAQAVFATSSGANSGNITIVDNANASPFPATLTIPNSFIIGRLEVTLADVTHPNPADLAVFLTGPTGKIVVLLGNAAGLTALNRSRIDFSTTAASAIPAGTAIINGAYLPTGSTSLTAGGITSTDTLSGFAGTDPRGVWSLSVVDTVAGSAGNIAGGFVLRIFSAPSLNSGVAITAVTTAEDTAKTITVPVADYDGSVPNVTASFGDATLAKVTATLANGIVTVVITPELNQSGANNVTLTATDNNNFSTSSIFGLTVTPVNDAPTINPVAKQIVRVGGFFEVPFTIGDVDTASSSLTVTASSSNGKLVPNTGIVLSGTGASRTAAIFPKGILSGDTDITLTVSDGSLSASTTFPFNVDVPSVSLFENAAQITVNSDKSTATTYPSTLTVSGLVGKITKVEVALLGITYPIPQDLDIVLVGPGVAPTKVVLMSDVGGSTALAATTLYFDDLASTSLNTGAISSGRYKPSDLEAAENLPTPAPAGLYATTLSAFNNSAPNGTWSLYVADDNSTPAQRGGVFFDGWKLSIQTSPKIVTVADQVTDEDTAKRVTVTLGDNQPGVSLNFTASVTSGTSIDNASIVVSGTGSTRTLVITPKANLSGTNTVSLSVNDGLGNTDTSSFQFIVTPVNDLPTISALPNKSTQAAIETGSIGFTVTDVETAAASLIVTATSSNNDLVPAANLNLVNGGGGSWTLNVLPAGINTGTATITVTVQEPTADGSQKVSKSFDLTVVPNLVFANSAAIAINDNISLKGTPATPFPSLINVSRVDGLVSKVTVVLSGFRHDFPADVDILLVSPDGKKSIVMSDAGGGTSVSNVRLTFSSTASGAVPSSTFTSGKYSPFNHLDSAEIGELGLPLPAPAGPYNADLTVFNGINPNGDWKLFVGDDTGTLAGAIDGGWILIFETSPTISAIAAQTTLEDVALVVPFTVNDSDTVSTSLVVTATATLQDPSGLVLSGNLVISTNTSNNRTLTITPSANLSGTNVINLQVTDGTTSTATSFVFTVVSVNDAPTVSTSTNRVITLEDTATAIVFNVADIDSILSVTNIVVTSSDKTLVPNGTNIVVGSIVSGAVTVDVYPTANNFGSTVLTFSIKDQLTTASTNVTLQVTAVNDLPTISAIVPQAIQVGGSSTNILFTVGDVETAARNLVVTASSDNQLIIPNANIVLGGSAESRSIQVTSVGSTAGTPNISVMVDDGTAKTTNTFAVSVSSPGTLFANTGEIVIRDNNTATTYPSKITVGGLVGTAFTVKVTLDGFTHTAPDDVDILLVGPTGKKVTLLSDAGGRNPVSNLRVRFTDDDRGLSDEAPIVSGNNAPSNYEGADTFPSPAPAGPYASALAEFKGTNPNGEWSLYVVDDTATDSGKIAFGWSIEIATNPTISGGSLITVNEDAGSTPFSFTIGDPKGVTDLVLTVSSDNKSLLPNENVTFNRTGVTAITGNFVTPTNAFGTNNLTITATRPSDGASLSTVFPMLVNSVNDATVISRLNNQVTDEGVPLTFEVLFSDVDSASTNLVVTATSSNTTLISDVNAQFGKTNRLVELPTGPVQFTLKPSPSQNGSATITVTVKDNGSSPVADVVSSFTLTVNSFNDAPVFSAIASTAISAGTSTTNIVFTVTDPDSGTVTLVAKSSDQSLVKDANITIVRGVALPGNQTNTVSIKSESGVEGSAVITLTATDNGTPAKSSSTDFKLNVRPSRERIFSNNRPITINDNAAASDYPSLINVSGLVGKVSKVTLKLNGFNHLFPDDVDMVLVSPLGTNSIVMSDAGGGVSVTAANSINLSFDQTAASAIPDAGSGLVAGTFSPFNYDTADTFPSPGPVGSHGNTFDLFKGNTPNGNWSLFIVDDTPSDAGSITNGWSIGITTEPSISDLATMVLDEDNSGRQNFTINEEATASTEFTFSITSTNSLVVPSANVVVSGSGLSRTLTVTPLPNAFGETDITVQLTNLDGQVVSSKFHVKVNAVPDAPVITSVSSLTLTAGSVSSLIAFDYSDAETAKKDLALTIESSDTTLIPVSNIILIGSELRIVAAGPATGRSTVQLTVSDGVLSASTSFVVGVLAPLNPVFANVAPITLNDNAKASPYASTVNVAGLNGTIRKVSVTLNGLNHDYPDDIDMMLVGPKGQTVYLMSDAGAGGTEASKLKNVRITFDDTATSGVPDNAAIQNLATYKPSNYEGSDTFPAPAPAGPYGATLSVFNDTDPNGAWSLYVVDDASPDAGSIVGGWQLDIVTTAPAVASVADQTTAEETPLTVNFKVDGGITAATNLVVRAVVGDARLATVALGGSGTDRSLILTPALNATGETTVTINVSQSDSSTPVSSTFKLTVTPVNDAPIITGLADFTSPANKATSIEFNVVDVETASANLVVAATISDATVGTVAVTGTGGVRNLVFTPSGLVPSKATLGVTVSDGVITVTNNILATVVAPIGPKVNVIAAQSADEDTSATVAFSVVPTESTNLKLTATAANPSLVSGVVIIPKGSSGTEFFANITLVPNAFGTSAVTITATDDFGFESQSFNLTVRNVNDAPVIDPIVDQTTAEDTSRDVVITVTDIDSPTSALSYSASSSNPALVAGVTLTKTDTGAVARIAVVPNANGTSSVTISVTDGTASTSRTFALTVSSNDDAPVLGAIVDQVTSEDAGVTIPLVVSDLDTAIKDLTFSATSTDAKLVSGVTFANDGTKVVAIVRLVADANGHADVTITAKDSLNSVSRTFGLTVNPVEDGPVLSSIADQVADEDQDVSVALEVSDIDTAIKNLIIVGTSSNPALVSGVSFKNDGTNVVAIVKLVSGANGVATVTITASDDTFDSEQTFNLTVNSVDNAPVLAVIANQTTREDTGLTLILDVKDSDTLLKDLKFSGSSTDTSVVAGVDFINDGKLVIARVRLVKNAFGRAAVTISASDTASTVARTFVLDVTAVPDAPEIGTIAPQSTTVGKALVIKLPITDFDTAIKDLVVTASSSNPGLVSGITIANDGVSITATVNLVASKTGSSEIAFTVEDDVFTVDGSFTLDVSGAVTTPVVKSTLSGGKLTLGVTGTPGNKFVVESTSDFVTWTVAGTLTVGADGTAEFVPVTGATSGLYFRLRSE